MSIINPSIYLQKGIKVHSPTDYPNQFYIQLLDKNLYDSGIYSGDNIKYVLDNELVSLYDKFVDLLFEDASIYYQEVPNLPVFVQEAGQDSDSAISAENFAEYIADIRFNSLPDFYKHLYLCDCQFMVSTIQNHLVEMENAFINYFIDISEINPNTEPLNDSKTIFVISPQTIKLSSNLENYFIKAYSILDLLTKIAIEFESPNTDFSSYKKLKSADKLWGERKKLSINKASGTVFEECKLISTVEALRNEVVHNGSWELNPKVFISYKNGSLMEKYMLFPDIRQNHLATVKNRRHFFSDDLKVNDIFPKLHAELCGRILNTVKLLNSMDFEDRK